MKTAIRHYLTIMLAISILVESCVGLSLTPAAASANPSVTPTVLIRYETPELGPDGSRISVDAGLVQTSQLAELMAIGAQRGGVAQKTPDHIELTIVVPSDFTQVEIDTYVKSVKEGMRSFGASEICDIRIEQVDVRAVEEEVNTANDEIEQQAKALGADQSVRLVADTMIQQNNNTLSRLRTWRQDFVKKARTLAAIGQWTAYSRDQLIGSVAGVGRGMLATVVWHNANGWQNPYAHIQAGISMAQEIILGLYYKKFSDWKGHHRLAFWRGSALARFYNASPAIKDFMIGTIQTVAYTSSMRLFSWMAHPEQMTGSFVPLLGGLLASSIFAAWTSQGLRTMRKKNVISSSLQFFVLQGLDSVSDIEGLLIGTDEAMAFWIMMGAESVLRLGFFLYSRSKPLSDRRVLAIHPSISETQNKDLAYRKGLDDALNIDDPHLYGELERAYTKRGADWSSARETVQDTIRGRRTHRCSQILVGTHAF